MFLVVSPPSAGGEWLINEIFITVMPPFYSSVLRNYFGGVIFRAGSSLTRKLYCSTALVGSCARTFGYWSTNRAESLHSCLVSSELFNFFIFPPTHSLRILVIIWCIYICSLVVHLCSVPLLCGLGLVQSPTVVTSVSFFGLTSSLDYWGLSLCLIPGRTGWGLSWCCWYLL